MARVLVVDDDQSICATLSSVVTKMGHEATTVATLKQGIQRVMSGFFDVVLLDVHLPDGNGLDMLPSFQTAPCEPEVIIITGEGDPDGAELAITSGAWDYIEKPPSLTSLTLPLTRVLQYRTKKTAKASVEGLKRDGIIGKSRPITDCLDLLAMAAHSDASILITGETGTGKELFARAVHNNSARSNRGFVVVDCAALPKTLVESMLFGYERGAFTGADKVHQGLIKQADGGTLFLDEVGELPKSVQKSFLRVLQERRFRPVGGREEVESDFRLVAATNRDLGDMVNKGDFRNDMLFRLRSMTIDLPPLRKRPGDILELALYHTNKLCERYGIRPKAFSPDLLEFLAEYDWPGNVRELVNAMERAIIAAQDEPSIYPKHLPISIRVHKARSSVTKQRGDEYNGFADTNRPSQILPFGNFRDATLLGAGKQYFHTLMSATGGNMKEACRLSGLSRARLYALLKSHGINRP